ncbi:MULTISPECIES: hypothetical protein [unclassified Legionella]|uniref:hypothetical protein n=1 Tax=unclassified Legionella TaxID=2622702 RepID=UPI001E33A3B4|nr:hypothetical protein [Legionella sp. 31fI33]MCC5013870.1 hypothetical protein [Legionella sp. 31fI33]
MLTANINFPVRESWPLPENENTEASTPIDNDESPLLGETAMASPKSRVSR